VPYIVATADFISAIGCGMSGRFFDLFFIQDFDFSPKAILALEILHPLVVVGGVKTMGYLATRPLLTKKFTDINLSNET